MNCVTFAFFRAALNYCLTYLSPIVVMAYEPFNPLAAAVLGWLILGEAITPRFVMGAACVAVGK